MIVLIKKQHTKLSNLTILILTFIFFQCSSKETNKDSKITDLQINNTKIIAIDKSKSDSKNNSKKIKVKDKSIVFFCLNDIEFKAMVKESGPSSLYEFEDLFRRFKSFSQTVNKVVEKNGINTYFVTDKDFVFYYKSGDSTTFNREKDEIVMGQFFFDGVKQPRMEQGLLNSTKITEIIKEYFALSNLQEIYQDSSITVFEDSLSLGNN